MRVYVPIELQTLDKRVFVWTKKASGRLCSILILVIKTCTWNPKDILYIYMTGFIFEAYTYFEKKYQNMGLFFQKWNYLFLDSFYREFDFFIKKTKRAKAIDIFFQKWAF